jgi:hypothetical protein
MACLANGESERVNQRTDGNVERRAMKKERG